MLLVNLYYYILVAILDNKVSHRQNFSVLKIVLKYMFTNLPSESKHCRSSPNAGVCISPPYTGMFMLKPEKEPNISDAP